LPGGGAKKKLDKHPEWVATFEGIVNGFVADLPQDESIVWVGISMLKI